MVQGLVSGNVTNGLDIDGAFGCVFDLIFVDNANAVAFTDDAGNHVIRGRVLTLSGGQTLYTTDPSLYDVIDLRMEGPATGKLMQLGNEEYRGGLRLQAMVAADLQNNTLFRDSATGKLSWKDGTGTTNALAPLTVNTQSGTSYTLALADTGAIVRCTSGSAVTVTVPANSTAAFAVGTSIEIRQSGAGQVTLSPAGGVTLNSESSMRKTAAQHRSVSLVKVATDMWDLDGSLAA
jgi:hypothetical protein